MIIGFQKAATTSLFKHLQEHPALRRSLPKEPDFFTYECHDAPPEGCDDGKKVFRYLNNTLESHKYLQFGGKFGHFEGSTHYIRGGPAVAWGLRRTFPWLKLIIQLREPISRAMSMLVHNRDVTHVGCLMRKPMHFCLLNNSQLTVRQPPYTYEDALAPWFEAFPADKIHVIQYEALTEEESMKRELRRVKKFLEIDPDQPPGAGLGLYNSRRFNITPDGWKFPKSQYQKLIDLVRPDMERVLTSLERHDKVKNRTDWVARWEEVWNGNLDACDESGWCTIVLS